MAKPEKRQQTIELLNGSNGPVYLMVVYVVFIPGAGPRTGKDVQKQIQEQVLSRTSRKTLSVLPPGRYHTLVDRAPSVMYRRHGVELAFTDRAGCPLVA